MSQQLELTEIRKNAKVVFIEWIATITIFIACFAYLAHKIDAQSNRTDRLYEMFIDLLKEKK